LGQRRLAPDGSSDLDSPDQAEWAFAADVARRSIPIYEQLGDEESAQLGRDALAVIES
jgi:hypothetical protein